MTNVITQDDQFNDSSVNQNKNDSVDKKNIGNDSRILVSEQLVDVDDVGFEDVYAGPVVTKELDIFDHNGNDHFFEGAEKRLVIYFNTTNVRYDLRKITR